MADVEDGSTRRSSGAHPGCAGELEPAVGVAADGRAIRVTPAVIEAAAAYLEISGLAQWGWEPDTVRGCAEELLEALVLASESEAEAPPAVRPLVVLTPETLQQAIGIYEAWEQDMGFDEYGGASPPSIITLLKALFALDRRKTTEEKSQGFQ